MFEGAIADLVAELSRLPGIGPKGAQRIAFHILNAEAEDVSRLAAALVAVRERVSFCETCGNV
ncbi:MAG: recombination protein RecR, partial [Candidatus Nanopelagicales bacterium]|nr:recombination protein RecR [Candidatus Nanopelagicales bacterium]